MRRPRSIALGDPGPLTSQMEPESMVIVSWISGWCMFVAVGSWLISSALANKAPSIAPGRPKASPSRWPGIISWLSTSCASSFIVAPQTVSRSSGLRKPMKSSLVRQSYSGTSQ